MFDFFKNLFSHKSQTAGEGTFHDPPAFQELTSWDDQVSHLDYQVACCQSSGRERSHNEDTLFTFNTYLAGVNEPISFGIYLVADGMGGHQSGEVASHLAAQGAVEHLIETVFQPMVFHHQNFDDEKLRQLVGQSVESAQKVIQKNVPGGGTTLTLLLVIGNQIFSAHVGDSRLYLIDVEGKMVVKTKDHSLVRRLVDLGQITENEASVHPQRNVLYRALGQAEPFEADTDQFTLSPGETLMICSDGLWGSVPDRKMKEMFQTTGSIHELSCLLVQAANDAGGPDNISVVILEKNLGISE